MKQGFTLLEIIVVIALVAIIGVGSAITVVKLNEKEEKNILVKNEDNFTNALEVYLSKHTEVVNNVNNEAEGAIISLEILKNEGLIKDNLKIDYEKNYFIVSTALLSNIKPSDLDGECKDSVSLNIIANWQNKNDSSQVLYFCPKGTTPEGGTPDLEELACKDITYNKDTIAYNVICNAKKNAMAIDNINGSVDGIVSTMNEMTINQGDNINNAHNEIKESIDNYFYNYTIYDEDATKPIVRSNNSNRAILSAYLSKSEDDGGESYYYRDLPIDNYVNFAGMTWRIYRIDGDGNIRLILHQKDGSGRSIGIGNFGYKIDKTIPEREMYVYDYLNPEEDVENAMVNIYKSFQDTLDIKIKETYGNSKDLSSFLVQGNWCIDNRYENNNTEEEARDIRNRGTILKSLKQTTSTYSFKCGVPKINKYSDGTYMYVSGVTIDEVKLGGNIFAIQGGDRFWTVNIASTYNTGFRPYYGKYQEAFLVTAYFSGYSENYWIELYQDLIHLSRHSVVPVIQLKAGTILESGSGFSNDPYIIKVN